VAITFVAIVQAHLKVEKMEPTDGAELSAPPASIQLFLTERPDLKVTKIELVGASGDVELGPAHMMGEKTVMAVVTGKMADGKYTVNWQTAGDDGHLQKGTFAFMVKRAK
jgi:methionine-rich copper-binding protein CopC